MRSRTVLLLLATAVAPQLPAVMQSDGITLRTNTRVVEINVSVRDSKGKSVDDLQPADFTITDNGKPRSFTIFNRNGTASGSTAATPAERDALPMGIRRPELPPGTFTNVGGSVRPPDGHSTVILLDAVNGWAENFMWSRKGVIEMLGKVPADEKIALYVIAKEGLATIQDYTTDRGRLLDAMKNYIVRGMAPAPPGTEPFGQGMMESPPIYRVGALKDEEGDSAQKSLALRKADMQIDRSMPARMRQASESVRLSLKALADKLRSQPGRKSVFWMTQGFRPGQIWGEAQETWEKTISELNDANVQVNTIDSNGLGGPPRFWGYGGIRAMQQIADETGGKAYYSRNDLDGALLEGIADSRSTYTLGFYLAEVDGKYHELKVRVDRPGVTLNYRQGYYALDEPKMDGSRKKSDLATALLNPVDSTAVGIVASLDVTPGSPRGMLKLRLRLDPDTLSLKESKAGQSGNVEELFVEFNAAGRELGRITAASPFEITPETRTAFESQGVTMVQSFGLPADAVKLTIIVRDTASGRVGSLTVPLKKVTRAGNAK